MPMVTVSISPEQAEKMREAVNCGDYASGSEVVRAALRLWVETAARDGNASRNGRASPVSNDEHLNVAELYAAHAQKRRQA